MVPPFFLLTQAAGCGPQLIPYRPVSGAEVRGKRPEGKTYRYQLKVTAAKGCYRHPLPAALPNFDPAASTISHTFVA